MARTKASAIARNKDKKSQSQKFVEAAQEIGCDDSEEAFADKLRHISTQKPSKRSEPERQRIKN